MNTIASGATVYVMGGYIPNGGTLMAYHLARIMHLRLRLPVVVVTIDGESADNGIFDYDPHFPTIARDKFAKEIAQNDILICNPSFSDNNFGIKLDCVKIMYVQDFKTYKFIDRFFDHYVAVSEFVHDFLLNTYGLSISTIPPFIAETADIPALAWNDRPANSILISAKGDTDLPHHVQRRLRKILRERAPDVDAAIDWQGGRLDFGKKIPQGELYRKLGSVRYLLSLTAAEGFGLVPLEAMAMGTAVVGFDAFGSRHYMRPGSNCLARSFPDVEGLAEDLIALFRDPLLAARLAAGGRQTAAGYGYDRFRTAWEAKFVEIFAHHSRSVT